MAAYSLLALVILPWLLWTGLSLQVCSLKVQMAGETQIAYMNHNVTIVCKIPDSPHLNIATVGIIWFWMNNQEEIKVFEYYGNHQKAFRPGATVSLRRLARGDASLQLPAIRLSEAGEYRCELVVTPDKTQGHVWLKVIAYPLMSLLPVPSEVTGHEDRYILCRASWFYPEDINITWRKQTQKELQYQEVSEDVISNFTVKNPDGTFNITSRLKLETSLENNMTSYQCIISHISLNTSKFNLTYTLNNTSAELEPEKTSQLPSICVTITVLILILIAICICLNRRKKQNKAKQMEERSEGAANTCRYSLILTKLLKNEEKTSQPVGCHDDL